MDKSVQNLIDRLVREHSLSLEGYETLLRRRTPAAAARLAREAVALRREIYGDAVYVRGLIEISNICKNDCLYCGIRRSNPHCDRYRLSPRRFWPAAGRATTWAFAPLCSRAERMVISPTKSSAPHPGDQGPLARLRRHPLPGGSGPGELPAPLRRRRRPVSPAPRDGGPGPLPMSSSIRHVLPTADGMSEELERDRLSGGLRVHGGLSGADCRPFGQGPEIHRGISPRHVRHWPLHPPSGHSVPGEPAGSLELTCYLLSILRLIHPPLLLPATTALGTIHPTGREQGILAGANVVMPNLSPVAVREKYALYDNKICTGRSLPSAEAACPPGCLRWAILWLPTGETSGRPAFYERSKGKRC